MVKIEYVDRVEHYDEADCFKLLEPGWFELRQGGEEGKRFALINASHVVSIAIAIEDRELIPA